jgi:3-hydroxybutyryl-CoA dehydrogenase
VFVDGADPALSALVERLGAALDPGPVPGPDSLILVAPLGQDCADICADKGYPPARTVGIEGFFGHDGPRRCLAAPVGADPAVVAAAQALFARDGARVTLCNDSVALVAQRIVAVIVNLGCEIAQQRVASPADIDTAVRIGLGYPDGPLALGDALGAPRILTVLEGLFRLTGDPRYRPSGWLRRRARLGLSLRTPDPV